VLIIRHGDGYYELRSKRGKVRYIHVGYDEFLNAIAVCKWRAPIKSIFHTTYLRAYGGECHPIRSTRLARRLWRLIEHEVIDEVCPMLTPGCAGS